MTQRTDAVLILDTATVNKQYSENCSLWAEKSMGVVCKIILIKKNNYLENSMNKNALLNL